MINTEDQERLFRLIAEYLENDCTAYAIGGTAMMFYGYKNATKDIDLVLMTENDQKTFIKAIQALGYAEKSILSIYDLEKIRRKKGPLMFSRGEERFDLFLGNVLGFVFDEQLEKSIVERRDFIGASGNVLTLHVLSKEHLILLKAITGRENDELDILSILDAEQQRVDWEFIVQEAVNHHGDNDWILLDLEDQLQRLKKKNVFLPQRLFDSLYAEQEKLLKK